MFTRAHEAKARNIEEIKQVVPKFSNFCISTQHQAFEELIEEL